MKPGLLSKFFLDSEGKQLAVRVFHDHVKPYKRKFALALIFMLLAALANSAIPFLLQPVFDHVFQNPDISVLILVCGGVFCSFLVKGNCLFRRVNRHDRGRAKNYYRHSK